MAPEALLKTIGTLLGDAMNTAVENGANSVSMPDEYVALAAWLCETPAAPQPAEPAQPATQAGAAPQPATTCPWCSACGCGNDVCGYAHLPGCLRAAQAQAQAEKGGA